MKLIKTKINNVDNSKDIVTVELDDLISFPVQIFKKEDGDCFVVLPKRNRKMNYGINTEYIEFTDMKYRDEFLNKIKKLYKENKIEEPNIKSEPKSLEEENFKNKPFEIDVEIIPITSKYVAELLNFTINSKIKFKNFKIIFDKNDIKITSPCFMKGKDLFNRFKMHDKLYSILKEEAEKNVVLPN